MSSRACLGGAHQAAADAARDSREGIRSNGSDGSMGRGRIGAAVGGPGGSGDGVRGPMWGPVGECRCMRATRRARERRKKSAKGLEVDQIYACQLKVPIRRETRTERDVGRACGARLRVSNIRGRLSAAEERSN